MPLDGQWKDHYRVRYNDNLLQELQQNGSVLSGVMSLQTVGAEQTYFDKTGKAKSEIKTQRLQDRTPNDPSYERRLINFSMVDSSEYVDPVDVMNMAQDPKGARAQAIMMEMGRQQDNILYNALRGSAVVTTDGAASNKALPSDSKIAVDNHFFDGSTGDTGLTSDKLRGAIAKLGKNHVDITRERIFVVANMWQLQKLATEDDVKSTDFRSKYTLEIPGIWKGLDGYLGLSFIHYEGSATDSSSNDLVYVFPASAVYYGIRKPLDTIYVPDDRKIGSPMLLASNMDLGAARMYEEKVIEIACDAA